MQISFLSAAPLMQRPLFPALFPWRKSSWEIADLVMERNRGSQRKGCEFSVCVSVCVCICACVHVCVCVCFIQFPEQTGQYYPTGPVYRTVKTTGQSRQYCPINCVYRTVQTSGQSIQYCPIDSVYRTVKTSGKSRKYCPIDPVCRTVLSNRLSSVFGDFFQSCCHL